MGEFWITFADSSDLTTMHPPTTIPVAGETDASSAEEQLARDNQLGVTDTRWGGPFRTVRPTLLPQKAIQNSLMPKKTFLLKAGKVS